VYLFSSIDKSHCQDYTYQRLMSTAIAQNITNNITLAVKLQHSIGRYTKRFPARTSHEPSFPGRGVGGSSDYPPRSRFTRAFVRSGTFVTLSSAKPVTIIIQRPQRRPAFLLEGQPFTPPPSPRAFVSSSSWGASPK